MKAAVCRAYGEDLVIEEVELADPEHGEIQVRIAACAICHSDILMIDGGVKTALPAVYGHEVSAVVEKIGPGVFGFEVGDHVTVTLIASCGECHYCKQGHLVSCESGFHLDQHGPLKSVDGEPVFQGLRVGGFAEYATVNASQACKLPKDLPLDIAAVLGCGVITGIGAVWNSVDMPTGATVAVVGLGGVGLNSIQGAAVSGASTIIGIDLAEDRLEAGMRFGATHGFNAKADDLVDQVKAVTSGRGVDFVFMAAGAKSAIEGAIPLMAKRGTMVIMGLPHKDVMAEYEPLVLAMSSQRIMGTRMGDSHITVDIPRIVSLYRQGKIKLDELVSKRYALEDINQALNASRNGEGLRNVIVF